MKKPLSKGLLVVTGILLALLNDAPRELVIKRAYDGNLMIISIVLKIDRESDTDRSQLLRGRRRK